jgi:hypothetical protein
MQHGGQNITPDFAELCEAVPPPMDPVEAGGLEAFSAVEARLGIALPAGYKSLIGAYGTGSWKGFLWVLNPFASNRFLNLFEQTQRQLEAERAIRADCSSEVPFPIYPEPGGLLPWAITDNGDRLYWLTEGNPENWAIVVCESRGPRYDSHHVGCCEFLRRWAAGELWVSVFPDDFEYGYVGAFEQMSVPDSGAAD